MLCQGSTSKSIAILHQPPLHSIMTFFEKVLLRSFPCLVTTGRNFIFSFDLNQIMLNRKWFFKWEGEGSNSFSPILRNLNSSCTQQNSPLNNPNTQTPKLGTGRVWWRKNPAEAKCDKKVSHILKVTRFKQRVLTWERAQFPSFKKYYLHL